MELIDREKYFENKEKMMYFIEKNLHKYGNELALILELALQYDLVLNPKIGIPSSLSQLFSKFGIYRSGMDMYVEFLNLLEQHSFLEGNCCEIASGIYPRLAKLAAPKIHMKHGSLTLYEPRILFSKLDHVQIIKEPFTKETDIDAFDTLFSIYPCDVTIPLVEKAFEEDKNLMVAFCSCDHSTKEHPKWFGKYWAEDFCLDYKEKYNDEVELIEWPQSVHLTLPIMVRKSTKYKEKIKSKI